MATDDVAAALAQVVVLGGQPTPREVQLGDTMAKLIQPRPIVHPDVGLQRCPTCGGRGHIVPPGEPK
jgi:hypothetical protein